MMSRSTLRQRGGALLAVLWLSAALSAIAFTVANTVRTETERVGTKNESLKAYYLATGAIERLLYYIENPGFRGPEAPPAFVNGIPRMEMLFPSGIALVEIIPEASKMSINEQKPEELARLLMALGADPARAQEITAAIVDWRAPSPDGLSRFDHHYMSIAPTFRSRHASVEEVEELLLVKGMTPELFYGSAVRDADGRLQPRAGLRDCVSVYGTTGAVDINTVQPAVLIALGFPPQLTAAIIQRRHAAPFKGPDDLTPIQNLAGPAGGRVTIHGGGSIFTLRATGRIRLQNGQLSDLSRSVSALVKFHRKTHNPPFETLRWYDN